VRAAVEAGISVIPIPGPTAAITALVASGLATDHFVFDGTVPRKRGERRVYLEKLRDETRTTVLYESPHRLLTTLEMISEVLPDRTVVLARELTKMHEEFLRGRAGEILVTLRARGTVKGECVLLIEGRGRSEHKWSTEEAEALAALLKDERIPNKAAVKILMCCFNLPRNEAYRLIHKS